MARCVIPSTTVAHCHFTHFAPNPLAFPVLAGTPPAGASVCLSGQICAKRMQAAVRELVVCAQLACEAVRAPASIKLSLEFLFLAFF
jgi:hypothetical protein